MGTSAKQQKKVPELRFSAFGGDWQKTTLKSLAMKIGDGIHTTPVYSEDGEFFFINGNNLDNGQISITESTKRLSTVEAIKHHRDLDTNTLLLSINGTVGNVAKYSNEMITLGKSACYIRLKEAKQVNFIYYLIQSQAIQRFYYSEVTGSTIKNLSLKSVANTPAVIPSSNEQQKIADFLGSVDAWLDNLRSQKNALETYKRGMMQKLFTQQVRFRDDGGKDFPEWTENEVGEFAEIYQPQTISQSVMDENAEFSVWGANGIVGKYKKYNHDLPQVIVTCRGSTCGTVNITGPNVWITGNAMVFNVDENKNIIKEFLYYSLKNDNLNYLISGSGQPQITSNIKHHKMMFPSPVEQQKIADFLTTIDQTITAKAEEITKVEQWKKGLMQKMFV